MAFFYSDSLACVTDSVWLFKHGSFWSVHVMFELPTFDIYTHQESRGEVNPYANYNVDGLVMDDFGTLTGGRLRRFHEFQTLTFR